MAQEIICANCGRRVPAAPENHTPGGMSRFTTEYAVAPEGTTPSGQLVCVSCYDLLMAAPYAWQPGQREIKDGA